MKNVLYATRIHGMRKDRLAIVLAVVSILAVLLCATAIYSEDSEATDTFGSEPDPYGSVSIIPSEVSSGSTYYLVNGGSLWIGFDLPKSAFVDSELVETGLTYDEEEGSVSGVITESCTLNVDGKVLNIVVVPIIYGSDVSDYPIYQASYREDYTLDMIKHVGDSIDERFEITYEPDYDYTISTDQEYDFNSAGIEFGVDHESNGWSTTYYFTVTGTVRESMEFDYEVRLTQMDIESHYIHYVYLTGHVEFYWIVTYHANGGTIEGGLSTKTENVTEDDVVTFPQVTRADYTCTGWWTMQSGGHNWGLEGSTFKPTEDTDLYAQWEQNTIPVERVDLDATATVQVGNQITLTARVYPTNADSTEIDWSIRSGSSHIEIVDSGDEQSGGTYTIRGVSQGTTVIRATAVGTDVYAECTVTVSPEPTMYSYTLIYDTNGGSNGPSTYTNQSSNPTLRTSVSTIIPTYSGHTFLGWSTDPDANEADFTGGNEITLTPGTTRLYAVWEVITTVWTLHFDANGGSGEPSDVTAPVAGTSYTFDIPDVTPTLAGHKFLGWSRSPDASEGTYQPGGEVVATSKTTTLYAVWGEVTEGNRFILVFELQGGTGGPSGIDQTSDAPTYTDKIPLTAPTRNGFTFEGWAERPGSATVRYHPGDDITLYPGTTTLYAVWSSESYVLTLDSNGGSTNNLDVVFEGSTGELTVTIPSDHIPEWDGHVFMGWSTEPTGEVTYSPGSSIKFTTGSGGTGTNIVLYAIWEISSSDLEYSLVYDIGEGATDGPDTVRVNPSDGETPVFTVSDKIPVREGYTFLGWSDEEGSNNAVWTAGDQITAKMLVTTIYAVWQQGQDTWTLSFDANGGSGAPGTLSAVVSGTQHTFEIPEDEPMMDGYVFQGWARTPDGEVYVNAGGSMIVREKSTILYAVWEAGEKVEFILQFDANGGKNPPASLRATDTGGHIFTIPLEVPTGDNVVFAGWATSNGGEAEYQPGSTIEVENLITTLYATWKPLDSEEVVFVLTYEIGDEAYNGPNQMTMGANTSSVIFTVSSVVPEWPGHEFLGWTDIEGGEVKYHAGDSFEARSLDSTLWAVWKITGTTAPNASIGIEYDGLTIRYSAAGSDNASTWFWDFGDGSTSGLESGSHTYSKPGKYIVSLTVKSDSGLSHTIKKEITVEDNGLSILTYVVIAIIAVIMIVVVLRYMGVI